ncbi:hypothetical protein D3C79_1116960 [compost metagenome]
MSCNLRVAAEMDGSKVAKAKMPPRTSLIDERPRLTRIMNSTNHQYSERLARPLKSAYLLKHTCTDS